MSLLIVAALALGLFQYWLLPASTKLKHIAYLMGTRDEPLPQTVMQQRIDRAANNLKESMVPFLALSLLAMIQGVDLSQEATLWLVLRVLYIPCYLLAINPIRTLVWLASLVCLIVMAVKLI